MAIARKKTHTARKNQRQILSKNTGATTDSLQLLARIDVLIRELEQIRQELTHVTTATSNSDLTNQLFGAAGKGTREEYDLDVDLMRFGEWQTR